MKMEYNEYKFKHVFVLPLFLNVVYIFKIYKHIHNQLIKNSASLC